MSCGSGRAARPSGWRPAFGQVRSAQGHLVNQGVEQATCFCSLAGFERSSMSNPALQLTWPDQTRRCKRAWMFGARETKRQVPGWLQIDEIWSFATQRAKAMARHPWLEQHAHADIEHASNTVYVSRPRLKLNGADTTIPGGACGDQFEYVSNDVHGPDCQKHDLGGLRVLISKTYWYFGNKNPPIPTDPVHLVHSTQGHVVHKQRREGSLRTRVNVQ
jgi:hypothetical protein